MPFVYQHMSFARAHTAALVLTSVSFIGKISLAYNNISF